MFENICVDWDFTGVVERVEVDNVLSSKWCQRFLPEFIPLLPKLTTCKTCFGTVFIEFSCSGVLENDVKELFWFWCSSLTALPGLDWDLLEGIMPHTDSKWCSLPHLLQDLPCAGHSCNLSVCLFLPQLIHLLSGKNLLELDRVSTSLIMTLVSCSLSWLWLSISSDSDSD